MMSSQSTILVLGVGPVPPEGPTRLMAPGLRVWSLAEVLARAGHRVVLAEAAFGKGDGTPAREMREEAIDLPHGVELWRVSADGARVAAFCRRLHAERGFAAAVANSDVMAAALCAARLSCPVWLDINGHPMAERQMLAAVYGSDSGLVAQWRLLVPILLGGDRYSTCSEAQRRALLGELAFAGRFEPTSGPALACSIPAVAHEVDLKPTGPAARGRQVPADARIVLWTGGYNTWTDVETLFEALSMAMEADPGLWFVSTGGAIDGHDDQTFRRFRERVDRSALRARFVFAGWVPSREVANYYAEADVAVLIDANSVEGRLGTRTRLIEWIQAGVPIAATPLCELALGLASAGGLAPYAIGDARALAEAIGRLSSDRAQARRQADRAREYLRRHHDAATACAPLLAWAARPIPAPDLPAPSQRAAGSGADSEGPLTSRLMARWGSAERDRSAGDGLMGSVGSWLRRRLWECAKRLGCQAGKDP